MNANQLEQQAFQINCQPYYWAYCLATKAASPSIAKQRDSNNAAYIVWISQQWTKTFSRLNIRDQAENRKKYHAKHLETLVNTIEETK